MKKLIRCSSLDRFLNCPGFIDNPRILAKDSDEAKEGTRKHAELEKNLISGSSNADYEFKEILDYVDSKKNKYSMHIEEFAKNDVIQGTPDIVLKSKDHNIVIDLKTGYIKIPPISKQLLGYALLSLTEDTKETTCIIFQPNPAGVLEKSEHTYTREEILKFRHEVKNTKKLSYLKMGDHCQFCDRLCHLQEESMKKLFGFTPSMTTISIYGDKIRSYMKKKKDAVMESDEPPEGFIFTEVEKSRRYINDKIAPDFLMKKVPVTLAYADKLVASGVISEDCIEKCIIVKTTKTKVLKTAPKINE